jgi:hypothetical protein
MHILQHLVTTVCDAATLQFAKIHLKLTILLHNMYGVLVTDKQLLHKQMLQAILFTKMVGTMYS